MDDDWSRCPICYEDYSPKHRPTTFRCGHSTCIDHTFGHNRLRNCPICRDPLNTRSEYNISYSLEAAARFYHRFKNTIDWSCLEQVVDTSTGSCQLSAASQHMTDKIQLEIKSKRETIEELTTTRPTTISPFSLAAASRIQRNQNNTQRKTCGHHCCLIATAHCCVCSDQRPHSENDRYDNYVDGHGVRQCAKRNQYYCPSCKQN